MSHVRGALHLLSNLGDAIVLAPASLGLVAFLLGHGTRRDAAAFVSALTICLTGALVAKFAFAACGDQVLFGVESPSGHSAFAAVFYGCLAALFGAGRSIAWRAAFYGGAAALVLLIAASRVALDAHTVPDVLIGLAIGAASVALFVALRRASERVELSRSAIVRLSPIALIVALCWILLAGRFVAEPYIDAFAARLGERLHLCP